MKTILVVDDEYALVEVLAELLEAEGYRVVTAANGKDGFARLQAERPDLVVTDLMMPIADGRDLVRRAQSLPEFRDVPVIMMSGMTRGIALSDATLTISCFLRKPFQWEQLVDAVVRLIGAGERVPPSSTPATRA